jgi:hypothetical protein
MGLQIIQAKPNPAGKECDKDQDDLSAKPAETQNPASLLFGEWVDVKNIGHDTVNFQSIQLRHSLFDQDCHTTSQLELYWIGDHNDLFKPGQVLRIHSGRREDAHLMAPEDQAGVDWHGYAESDKFILNIYCGDKIVLSWEDAVDQLRQDWACYAPNPPENLILKRSGNLLAGAALGSDINQ